jgi:HAD superfamily hydrolase (TIGR01509 family)
MSIQLELPESIRGVLFDCDGTILDSEPLHAENLSVVVKSYGLNISSEEISARFRGFHDEQVYDELFNENSSISKEEFLQTKTNALLRQLNLLPLEEVKKLLTPGFMEAFEYLKKNKYLVAIVSASEEVFLESLLNKLGIRSQLDCLVHGGSTLLPKPSPAPYLMAMRQLELHPEETVIFEDSHTGIASAQGSGAETVKVVAHHPDSDSEEQDSKDLVCTDNFFWLIKEH